MHAFVTSDYTVLDHDDIGQPTASAIFIFYNIEYS